MDLLTKLELTPQTHHQIDYQSKVMLFGSCFSEHIAEKLEYFKFQNLSNPFGILFQPLAIEKLITRAINEDQFTEDDLFFLNEQWHSFDVHSVLSTSSKADLLETLNTNLKLTHNYITESNHLVITLGTAWSYRHIETDAFVANCHKVPQKRFLKTLLPIDVISESLQAIVALVRSINSNINILFTVSPVRHLKDGFIENTQSKSHLISAIHQVVDARKQLFYFPSYEIMMDELRDYRFYKADMIHPSPVAVNYIWEKFHSVWISEKSHSIMQEVDVIQKGLLHKPFNPKSDAHKTFLKDLKNRQSLIKSRVSHIVF